jgi:hypothetical protein
MWIEEKEKERRKEAKKETRAEGGMQHRSDMGVSSGSPLSDLPTSFPPSTLEKAPFSFS